MTTKVNTYYTCQASSIQMALVHGRVHVCGLRFTLPELTVGLGQLYDFKL